MTTEAQAPTQAIVKVDQAPAVYGSKPEVKALALRILSMHPSAKKIGEGGATLAAQLGIVLNLNPMPGVGHLHIWWDDGLVVCIGLEGRAALARRDSPYSVSTRPMRSEEAQEHGLQPGDRGSICELYRHDVTREQAALKIPIQLFIGIGITKANERVVKGRSLAWRASQRAIKDALKQAYSIRLPDEFIGQVRLTDEEPSFVDDVTDSEVVEGHATEVTSATEAQKPTRPYDPQTLKAKLIERTEANANGEVNNQRRGLIAGKLAEVFAPDADADAKRKAVMGFLFGVDSVKDMTAGQVLATLEWLRLAKDAGGDYRADVMAETEARAVLTLALKEAGQMELTINESEAGNGEAR